MRRAGRSRAGTPSRAGATPRQRRRASRARRRTGARRSSPGSAAANGAASRRASTGSRSRAGAAQRPRPGRRRRRARSSFSSTPGGGAPSWSGRRSAITVTSCRAPAARTARAEQARAVERSPRRLGRADEDAHRGHLGSMAACAIRDAARSSCRPLLPDPPVTGGQKRTLRLLEAMERAGAASAPADRRPGSREAVERLQARGWAVDVVRRAAARRCGGRQPACRAVAQPVPDRLAGALRRGRVGRGAGAVRAHPERVLPARRRSHASSACTTWTRAVAARPRQRSGRSGMAA